MTVGRYYLRAGDPMGAIGRFRTVVDKYQTTSHTPEALYRLVETYLTVGLVGEAQKNGAVLGYNYPGDPWYQAAYTLLTNKGYQPAVAPSSGGRRGPHFPFFGRHDKSTTLPPPGEQPNPANQTADAATAAPQSDASAADPVNTHTPAPPPKKNTGFVHGVLGL
jgi:outer membrane protein assembly factor BamD